jgi:hypothetical protein
MTRAAFGRASALISSLGRSARRAKNRRPATRGADTDPVKRITMTKGGMINAARRKWRRVHRDGIVAEVTPLPGTDTWHACARRRAHAHADHINRPFTFLSDAQAAADRLVLTICPHTCDEGCGTWDPVERRTKSRIR